MLPGRKTPKTNQSTKINPKHCRVYPTPHAWFVKWVPGACVVPSRWSPLVRALLGLTVVGPAGDQREVGVLTALFNRPHVLPGQGGETGLNRGVWTMCG